MARNRATQPLPHSSDTAALILRAPPAPSRQARAGARVEQLADEALVDRAVEQLRRIFIAARVRALIDAGEYVIEHFYGGVDEARSRHPRKPASLRRLCSRSTEFGMNATSVSRAVRVAIQARDLGASLALRLGQEQHLALLPLRDPEEKRVLAESAAEENWTGRQLRKKVLELQPPHPGGRPARPRVLSFARRLGDACGALDASRVAGELAGLTPGELRHLGARLRAAEALLARLQRILYRVRVH